MLEMTGLTTYFTYNWFRDIWLPAAGAILIPVAIAFFTWFFGASRHEKQKELNDLRDNLNLLISLILGYIELLGVLRVKIVSLYSQNKKIKNYNKAINDNSFFSRFSCDNILEYINMTSYASCLEYDEDFLVKLLRIRDMGQQLQKMMEDRNNSLRSMAACENIKIREERYLSFLEIQPLNLENMLNLTDACLVQCYKFAKRIKIFEKKEKNLRLNSIEFGDETYFSKIEDEYKQRNKNND